jgi:hypothetical protein
MSGYRWILLFFFVSTRTLLFSQTSSCVIFNLSANNGSSSLQLTSFPDFAGKTWWVFSDAGVRIPLSQITLLTPGHSIPFNEVSDSVAVDTVKLPLRESIQNGVARMKWRGTVYAMSLPQYNPAESALNAVKNLDAKTRALLFDPVCKELPGTVLKPGSASPKFPLDLLLREAGYFYYPQFNSLSQAQKLIRYNIDAGFPDQQRNAVATHNAAKQVHYLIAVEACQSLYALGYLQDSAVIEKPFEGSVFQPQSAFKDALNRFIEKEHLSRKVSYDEDPRIIDIPLQKALHDALHIQNETGQSLLKRLGYFTGPPNGDWLHNDSARAALIAFAKDMGYPLDTAGLVNISHAQVDSLQKRAFEYFEAAAFLSTLGFPDSTAADAMRAYSLYLHHDSVEKSTPIFTPEMEEALKKDQTLLSALLAGFEDSTVVKTTYAGDTFRIVSHRGERELWVTHGDSIAKRLLGEKARLPFHQAMESHLTEAPKETNINFVHVQPWTENDTEAKLTVGEKEFTFSPKMLESFLAGKDSAFSHLFSQWFNTQFSKKGQTFIVVLDEIFKAGGFATNKKAEWLPVVGPVDFFESNMANPVVFSAYLSELCGASQQVYLSSDPFTALKKLKVASVPRKIGKVVIVKSPDLAQLIIKESGALKGKLPSFITKPIEEAEAVVKEVAAIKKKVEAVADSLKLKRLQAFLCPDSVAEKLVVFLDVMAEKGIDTLISLTGDTASKLLFIIDTEKDNVLMAWTQAKWLSSFHRKKYSGTGISAIYQQLLDKKISIRWRILHPFLPSREELIKMKRAVMWL